MRTWLLIALCCALPAAAAAQTYPSKTITLVVPAPPGGVTDVLARTLAQRFTAAWGQQAIVENRPGGNNQVAAEYVTRAPDGHTLLIGPEVTFIANPALYGKLNYDPINGFTAIVGLVTINHALITHPSLPVANVRELIALAKQKPGELNYGTYGAGSTGHLNMELFQVVTGTKLTAVHYRGAAPAMTDVIGGHIQMMYAAISTAASQVQDGKVKLIAIGSAKRMDALPDVPTVAENGLLGYEAVSWFGLFGPPGMPASTVAKINAEVRSLFADPEIKKTVLDRYYFESLAGTPEQLASRIKADEPKWRKIIEDAKVRPQ
jgi:tripartite-type tricarboxylate transporter receptor subunit TctC